MGSDGAGTSYKGSPHSLVGTSLGLSLVPATTGPVRQPWGLAGHSGGGSISPPSRAGLASSLRLEEVCAHQKPWFPASLYLLWEEPWLGSRSCVPSLPFHAAKAGLLGV